MTQATEARQSGMEHGGRPRLFGARRVFAAFAIFAGAVLVAGCESGDPGAAAAQGPTASPTSWATETWSPYPYSSTSPTAHPRGEVFLRGIINLPNDLELDTIIDRICRLREEDDELVRPTTPSPNADEIETLERGYDRLYSDMNGLPGPASGGERWALREEMQQCPQAVPRTPGR